LLNFVFQQLDHARGRFSAVIGEEFDQAFFAEEIAISVAGSLKIVRRNDKHVIDTELMRH